MSHDEFLMAFGASVCSFELTIDKCGKDRLSEIAATQRELLELFTKPRFYWQPCKDTDEGAAHCDASEAEFFGIYKVINGFSYWITDVSTREDAINLVGILVK